jgi:hypothetical protein
MTTQIANSFLLFLPMLVLSRLTTLQPPLNWLKRASFFFFHLDSLPRLESNNQFPRVLENWPSNKEENSRRAYINSWIIGQSLLSRLEKLMEAVMGIKFKKFMARNVDKCLSRLFLDLMVSDFYSVYF